MIEITAGVDMVYYNEDKIQVHWENTNDYSEITIYGREGQYMGEVRIGEDYLSIEVVNLLLQSFGFKIFRGDLK